MKILITGSSGFIGQALMRHLGGHELWSLVRSPQEGKTILWNPQNDEIPLAKLEGFDAVFHLAGKNISGGRWTARRKNDIFSSRTRDTWLLARAMSRLKKPPKFFFSTSAVGFYGDRGEEVLTEASFPGKGFLPSVCLKWEEATQVLEHEGVAGGAWPSGLGDLSEGGHAQKNMAPISAGFGRLPGERSAVG